MSAYRYYPVKNGVPGIVWPALPSGTGASLLSLLAQFQESEWLPQQEIASLQYDQASRLATFASKTVPFYAGRLAAAGIEAGRTLTPEEWRRIPLLTREDIQNQGEALGSRPYPESHGKRSRASTSGSTGKPVTVLSTDVTQKFWLATTLRDHLWHDRDLSQKFAVIRKVKGHDTRDRFSRNVNSWGSPVNELFPSGPGVLLSINTAVEEQLAWLEEERPGYLLTYPTNLQALIDFCRQSGKQAPGLRQVRTMAEIVPPDLRLQCREVLGATIADMYSSQECGYLALQCPGHDHYLVQAETVLLEVIDSDGNPCRPGETGRVVVTPLVNYAMPLLRYEIGDLATVGGPSPCGRGLPVLERILGRVRNMLVKPDGDRIWPAFGTKKLMKLAPIRQYQFVQTDRTTVEVRLVLWRPASEDEEAGLITHISAGLPEGMQVVLRYLDEIPRSAGGKYEDFVCSVRD